MRKWWKFVPERFFVFSFLLFLQGVQERKVNNSRSGSSSSSMPFPLIVLCVHFNTNNQKLSKYSLMLIQEFYSKREAMPKNKAEYTRFRSTVSRIATYKVHWIRLKQFFSSFHSYWIRSVFWRTMCSYLALAGGSHENNKEEKWKNNVCVNVRVCAINCQYEKLNGFNLVLPSLLLTMVCFSFFSVLRLLFFFCQLRADSLQCGFQK